jgi:phage FluMu protein Com
MLLLYHEIMTRLTALSEPRMNGEASYYIWRCAKCSNHLVNINRAEGYLKMEKKCPKCKALNILTLQNRDIMIQCQLFDPTINGYPRDVEGNIPFQYN